MYHTPQATISSMTKGLSIPFPSISTEKPPRFSLDTSGVAGLLGGDDAISAMATVHIYGNRRWLGWYNTPGSFQIAKRFRSFAKYASFRSTFGGTPSQRSVHMDPMKLFEMDSCKGPKYWAAHSGTVIEETGHLAALFMKECAAWNPEGKVIPGRKTQPIGITVADLGSAPPFEMHPAHSSTSTLLFACVPIATSVGTCVLCAIFEDWYASLLILVGVIASGISCFVLGSAKFLFTHPEPAQGSPAGDGILGSNNDIVLLRGSEGAVNSITRGRFTLQFSSEAHYNLIRWCSLLLIIQCITQLLLISQASLFGQIMFLTSLGVSALYNARISSLDKEKIHQKFLLEKVLDYPLLTRYTLGTRTTAVVFILLVLQPQDPARLLNELLPNDTKVWKEWKAKVLERLRHPDDPFVFDSKVSDLYGFTQQEVTLLGLLYGDAQAAYNGYKEYFRADAL